MPFPKTDAELKKAGYEYESTGRCKGCGEDIEWWRTPKGKAIPLDPGTMEAHFSTCPQASQFRGKK